MYLALAFPIAKGTRKDTNFPSQQCTCDVPYPPITDYVTGKKTRREFLQLHIWEKPKGSLQRQHNADTLFVAEQIRFERENALLKSNIYSDLEKEHIAYLERSEKKFIEYYEESFKAKPLAKNQLTAGTDITTVSKMLGHSDLKTTMIYAKVVDNVKREAADRVKLKF